jgi:hypothetical protein
VSAPRVELAHLPRKANGVRRQCRRTVLAWKAVLAQLEMGDDKREEVKTELRTAEDRVDLDLLKAFQQLRVPRAEREGGGGMEAVRRRLEDVVAQAGRLRRAA